MFRLFCRQLFTRRYIAIGIAVIFAVGSLPGIALACEGAGEEPTISEGLEEAKGPPCVNMVLKGRCFVTYMALKDEVEIEGDSLKEEAGKTGRYEKSQIGCKAGLKLKEGVKEKEGCLDVLKVIKEETGTDEYCVLYKNEVTGVKKLEKCLKMSIK